MSALRRVAKENDGMVLPEVVVDAARPESSPLHKYFTWEDTEAAEKWRIHEARNLLRVTVEYIGTDKNPVRVFVSLTNDREDEGGYRVTADVMDDAELYRMMLQDALDELESFRRKYERIKELRAIFREAKKLRMYRK